MRISAMMTTAQITQRQRRLRSLVQRLVIELGYLEHCLAEGVQDTNLQTAAAGLDTAIDCVNEHLAITA
jgi:hypothetical protein